MLAIRSFIFNILFTIWTALLCIIFIPLTWLGHKASTVVGITWAHGTFWMLKLICGISYKIEGTENLPKGPCIIASKHQSAWDTVVFFILVPHPIYVVKKELLKIPLFGSFMSRMGMIAVDRKGGSRALKKMLQEVKERIDNGMSLVIFPEGTRTDIGEAVKYHPGIASIYQDKNINIPIVPVALDSGKCWSKKNMLKHPGVITLKILKPMPQDIDRKQFMKDLQESIENGCKSI